MKPALAVRLLTAIPGMLLVLAVTGRFFPDYLFHWDEVQLTLGLERFDLRSHQPHPPGYYLFVLLGRLVRPFVASPENALRWVAALAASAVVGLTAWWLPRGLKLQGRVLLVAAAALFVVCSPVLLFHSVSALTYTTEAACWLGLLLAVARRPRGWWLFALALAIGLAGGFRQTLIVWGVVAVALAWATERSWLDRRGALRFVGGLVAGILLWGVPMLLDVGGWGEYRATSGALVVGNIWEKSVLHEGVGALGLRLARMLADLWLAAGPLLVVAAAGLAARFVSASLRERLARRDLLPAGAALAFVFYAFLIYDSDGYILAVAVPLVAYGLLAVGAIVGDGGAWKQALGGAAAALVAASLVLLPGGFARSDDRGQRRYARHDAEVRSRVGAVSRAFDPGATLLVTSHEYWQWSFRHVMYYLPGFTTLQLIPDRFFVDAGPERPYLTARGHEVRLAGPDGLDVRSLDGSFEQVVYAMPHELTRFVSSSCLPFVRPLPVTASESFGVLRLAEADVRVERAQLHCRPPS